MGHGHLACDPSPPPSTPAESQTWAPVPAVMPQKCDTEKSFRIHCVSPRRQVLFNFEGVPSELWSRCIGKTDLNSLLNLENIPAGGQQFSLCVVPNPTCSGHADHSARRSQGILVKPLLLCEPRGQGGSPPPRKEKVNPFHQRCEAWPLLDGFMPGVRDRFNGG